MSEQLQTSGGQEYYFKLHLSPEGYAESKVTWLSGERTIEIGVHTYDQKSYSVNIPPTGSYFANFKEDLAAGDFALVEYKELPLYRGSDYAARISEDGEGRVLCVYRSGGETLLLHFDSWVCDVLSFSVFDWTRVISRLKKTGVEYLDYKLVGNPRFSRTWKKDWTVGEYPSEVPSVIAIGAGREAEEVFRMDFPELEGMANLLRINFRPAKIGKEAGTAITISKEVLCGAFDVGSLDLRGELRDPDFFKPFKYEFTVPSCLPKLLLRLPVETGSDNKIAASIRAQKENLIERTLAIRDFLQEVFKH